MKRLLIIAFILMGYFSAFAQGQGITYQAVILNPDGKSLPGFDNPSMPMSDRDICLKFSFIDDLGENEYEEVIATTTDVFGMVNVVIGTGERIGGRAQTFGQILWDSKSKSLEVSLDKDGLCAQFVQISLQQFTAVPFALFALNSGDTASEALAGKSAYEVWLDLGNTGTVVEFINSLKGPQGSRGEQGAQGGIGLTGPEGKQGQQGEQGLQGSEGEMGLQGIQGIPGIDGINGIDGAVGPQGANGAQGDAGTQGPIGLTGEQGLIGLTGPEGKQGQQGEQGLQGSKGEMGLQGIQGIPGIDGINGIDGAVGPQGANGAQGDAGSQGPIGLTGEEGATGPQGPKGDGGTVGKSAYQVWMDLGNTGSESEFIAFLTGLQGEKGETGANNGITYTVTNSGSGAYLINGASNPPLTVIRGMTYIFQINAAGHPFWLQTTSGSYNASNIYSTGITDNGEAVGTITWQVPFDAPNTVYYACQFHSSMNGQLNVSDAGPVGPQGIQGVTGPAGPTGTNASVGGFTHYLGEPFDGGIIYYLYKGSDGLEHGLIVALTESSAIWQTTGTLVNASRSWDGAYNTALMTGSLAADYITSLGAGWYLPSIDELGKLFYNRFETNKALSTTPQSLLLSNTAFYWSSTEDNTSRAYLFRFETGSAFYTDKRSSRTVRGVRAF